MKEKIFNELCMVDLIKLNSLAIKGYFETTDFDKAVSDLINSLSAYVQEVGYENCEERKCLQESRMAEGA